MGGGASIQDLPDYVNKVDLEAYCGSGFDKSRFDTLKNFDELMDRNEFLAIAQKDLDNGLSEIFNRICPSGQMDSRIFHKICKCTGLFDMKGFTVPEADITFHKICNEAGVKMKYITYELFKTNVIQDISYKIHFEYNKLLYRK